MNEFKVVLDDDVQDWLSALYFEDDFDFVINRALRIFMEVSGCEENED